MSLCVRSLELDVKSEKSSADMRTVVVQNPVSTDITTFVLGLILVQDILSLLS